MLNKKDKVLFVIDEFFPISSAPSVRINSFIKAVAHNFNVEVLCGSETRNLMEEKPKHQNVNYHILRRPPEKRIIGFSLFLCNLI